jgi:dihydrofolate synthase/folylpolyglutamate synthase
LAYLDALGNEVLAMKFGLETTKRLLVSLGNPQLQYPAVLVAGTNGKGSVVRFLESICRAAGMRTGLFTSPHLERIEERFCIDGKPIGQGEFSAALGKVLKAIRAIGCSPHPTFFETVTVTALEFFARQAVDLALLEVGMGGRLDSTNAVDPVLSIITTIGYDHQQYLGRTLKEIAGEKAGIMRSGTYVVSSPQNLEVRETLREKASQCGAHLEVLESGQVEVVGHDSGCYHFKYGGEHYSLAVAGRHQAVNAATAVRAAEILDRSEMSIPVSARKEGVSRLGRVPGAIEVLSRYPTIVLDGGHNPQAAACLGEFVREHTRPPRTMVFGIMRDKDFAEVMHELQPHFDFVYLTRPDSPRAADPRQLAGLTSQFEIVDSAIEAFHEGVRRAPATIVIAGSFYLVGEISQRLLRALRLKYPG